jgi:ABC-type branched-subunit amino acid transport system permease subunit
MRNPLRFFVELMQQPIWISLWVFFLMIVNMASLAFWHEPIAQLILTTFLISAMLMMGLYSRFGFAKILGLGHVPWIPLLAFVVIQIPSAEVSFKRYLMILSASIAISLAFDVVDVWKHFRNWERR